MAQSMAHVSEIMDIISYPCTVTPCMTGWSFCITKTTMENKDALQHQKRGK